MKTWLSKSGRWLVGVLLAPSLFGQTTWDGSDSSAWDDPNNWDSGVPTAATDAIIPAGTPFSPSTDQAIAVCDSLTVLNGATLEVAQSFDLTASGSADIQGTLTTTGSGGPARRRWRRGTSPWRS